MPAFALNCESLKKKQDIAQCKEHAVNCLSWKTAQRNDTEVAKEVYDTRRMDAVYGMGDITLVDELFYYIREDLGLLDKWEKIQPNSIERVLIPFNYYLILHSAPLSGHFRNIGVGF